MTLDGAFRVALPVAEAFRLFTARGEREWVDGWEPVFPEPVDDDAAAGTVFRTDHGGQDVTWVVVDRDGDRRIRYARVAAGRDAGTVEVRLAPAGPHTEVAVTYRVTALTPSGVEWFRDFTAGYPDMMRSWEAAIDRVVAARGRAAPLS
ncbi:SRPBCC family protein [Actinoplanes sp. NPDC051633]|uniref:SRPBCC family protein n=1 Tax=Actinoplanes sp. NPDC051633 TaxID=3155670 RepID=UPI0034446E9B